MADTETTGASATLTRKYGPLAGWQWGAIVVLLALAFIIYRQRKAKAAALAAGPSAGDTVPSYPTTGDLAAAGLYQPPDSFYAGDIQGPQGLQGPPGVPGASATPPSTGGPGKPGPGLPVRPAPSPPAPAASMAPAATGTTPAQPKYVTVQRWPSPLSTLSGIAAANGKTLAQVEALNPQYAGNWNLIYTGEQVRVA